MMTIFNGTPEDHEDDLWVDADAGPVVRPYAMTRGRTQPLTGDFDLITIVVADRTLSAADIGLGPEHHALVQLCQQPQPVAELSAYLDLPVGSCGSCSVSSSAGCSSEHTARVRSPPLHPTNSSKRSSVAFDSSSPAGTAAAIIPDATKILIAGGFGVGKTTLVGAVSEILPLRTEEKLTEAGVGIDSLAGVADKTTTTVAMDFGRITISSQLVLYLFGTPGQDRFFFLWDELAIGARGAVVLADTRRLDDSFPSIDYFEQIGMPFIVAVNCFDGARAHEPYEVSIALDLGDEVPVVLCDARNRESAKSVLITLLQHARQRARLQRAGAPPA